MIPFMIRRLLGLRFPRLYVPSKPLRDDEYLRWIRKFPCCICHWNRRIEAAHTGPHGLGQKSSDYAAIPLCDLCHRLGERSIHKLGPLEFERAHSVKLAELVEMFNAMWRKRKKAA